MALGGRLVLLASLSFIIGLVDPLFEVLGQEISGRDLILLIGGIFLVGKATLEIHDRLEGEDRHGASEGKATFKGVLLQISVITAVGLVDQLYIMVAAVTIAIMIMLVTATAISNFVNQHPTVKMLALSFLVLIGATLFGEGLDIHTPKGLIYGPIAFSIIVEALRALSQFKPGVQASGQTKPACSPISSRAASVVDPPMEG